MRPPAALLLVALAACTSEPAAPPAPAPTVAYVDRAPLPLPRTEVAAAVWDGRIAVVGGYARDGRTVANVDLYDPATDTWTAGPPLPEGRNHAAAAVLGGRLYVSGGNDGRRSLASVVSLGPGEASWRAEAPLRTARGAHGMVAAADRLVVFGGANGPPLRSTEVFSGSAWSRGPDLSVAREHLAAAAVGSKVYAIGGRVRGLEGNLPTVESYDPGGPAAEWTREPDLVKERGGTSAAGFASGPCVAGGEERPGTIRTVECLRGGAWRVVAELSEARHGVGVVALDGRLHVIAGGPRPGLSVSGRHEVFGIEGS